MPGRQPCFPTVLRARQTRSNPQHQKRGRRGNATGQTDARRTSRAPPQPFRETSTSPDFPSSKHLSFKSVNLKPRPHSLSHARGEAGGPRPDPRPVRGSSREPAPRAGRRPRAPQGPGLSGGSSLRTPFPRPRPAPPTIRGRAAAPEPRGRVPEEGARARLPALGGGRVAIPRTQGRARPHLGASYLLARGAQ